MQDLESRVLEAIRGHIDDGQKIEAIKLLRESTGVGLAEAKTMIEEFASTGVFSASSGRNARRPSRKSAGRGLPLEVQRLLRKGKQVEAITELRDANGLGLKEAKDEVDAFLKLNPELIESKSSGPGMAIAAVILVVLGVAAWMASRMVG